jgi:hypothetical protein
MGSLVDELRHEETRNAGMSGAVSELVASVDLMRRGFHVFRALSATAPSDLLVYRGHPNKYRMIDVMRVQVRTARVNGRIISFPLKSTDRGAFDLLALVADDNPVYYLPMLPGSPRCPYGINITQLELLRSWGILHGAGWQGMRPNLEASP